MTRKEAIAKLITDFVNGLIASGVSSIDEIDLPLDKEIAKALKIKFQKEEHV